jgi:hypothetical protein
MMKTNFPGHEACCDKEWNTKLAKAVEKGATQEQILKADEAAMIQRQEHYMLSSQTLAMFVALRGRVATSKSSRHYKDWILSVSFFQRARKQQRTTVTKRNDL